MAATAETPCSLYIGAAKLWVIAILKTEEYKIISQMLLAFKTWPRINRDKPRRYDN
uniref:Uncharacterized protein n=1 Tax=Oryza meridionalis TaxID=40149 RepID=A0A0E0E967_9ORYZ